MMFGRSKTPTTPFVRPEPLRTGVYQTAFVGAGLLNKGQEFCARVEVAEWETLGHLSRVTILDISGVSRDQVRQVRELIGSWVPTASVIWRAALDTSAPGATEKGVAA